MSPIVCTSLVTVAYAIAGNIMGNTLYIVRSLAHSRASTLSISPFKVVNT
jgi:hypothetical protein